MLTCNKCQQEFTYDANYQKHLELNTCIQKYKCTICNSIFLKKFNLQRHINNNSCDKTKFINKCTNNSNVGILLNHIVSSTITIQDSHETITNVENIENIDQIANANNVENINNIVNVGNVANVANVASVANIGSVDTININVTLPNFIRPLGLEDVTFLNTAEMLSVLSNENPEIMLLRKLNKKYENINFFKYNINHQYVSYLESILEIVSISDKSFEQKVFANAHLLLNALFYLSKDKISFHTAESIAYNLYNKSYNKNANIMNKNLTIPDSVIDDVKSHIYFGAYKKMKKNIEKFVENIKKDKTLKDNINNKLNTTVNLLINVKKDMSSLYKAGLDKIDIKFLEDLDFTKDENKEKLNDPIIYDNYVKNEVARFEFRYKHNTLYNFIEQVKRIDYNRVDEKVLKTATAIFMKKKKEDAHNDYINEKLHREKYINSEILQRDIDIDEELEIIS